MAGATVIAPLADLRASTATDYNARFEAFLHILQAAGAAREVWRGKMLDFGCGDGSLIKSALGQRIDAYGCDISFDHKWVDEATLRGMKAAGRVRQIETPYRLPFDDSSFNVVISDQVFEHVMDYGQALDELHRVMKPGGICVHMFPTRYRLIEGHIFVPLAGFFAPRWWLRLWAALGVRNQFQRGMTAAPVAVDNAWFLASQTNYMSPALVDAHFGEYFDTHQGERNFLSFRRPLVAQVPGLAWLYRTLSSRVIVGRKAPGIAPLS